MNNHFILRTGILMLLLAVIFNCVNAQDSLKKTATAKKTVTKPAVTKPGAIPINPKTGKPYTRYGYGSYAKTYQATHIADSLKKAAALKVGATPVTTAAPQTDTPAAPVHTDKSLNGQYKYLLTKVYNYQQPFIAAIWKNFMDTLTTTRKQLKVANGKLAAQGKSISDLQANVTSKEQTLSESNSNADMINFIGIPFSKNSYSLMVWGLVIVFGATAVIVIARSGSNKKEAEYRTTLYSELEEEFKAYKAKANEKEKKLARELQTERNKVDELMGR